MKTPKISIIIPIYNVENYLENCLLSILESNDVESLMQIEIIGIDDQTPDNSDKVFLKVANEFPQYNIHLIKHKKNKGLGGARNTGILNAKGEFVLFLDSDDWMEKNAIDYLLKNSSSLSQSDLLIFGFTAKKEGKKVWEFSTNKTTRLSSSEALKMFAKSNIPPSAWNKLYPSKLLSSLKFEEHLYYEDLEFTPRALQGTGNVILDKSKLICYRLDGTSITRQNTKLKHIEDLAVVLQKLYDNLFDREVFSSIFFDRWAYLLKSWNLRNELKLKAIQSLNSQLTTFELSHSEMKDKLVSFIQNDFNSYSLDILFHRLKKNTLELLGSTNTSNQSPLNQIFDKIYVVNLSDAIGKRAKVGKQLQQHNIEFEFWNATNGYLHPHIDQYKEYQKREVGELSFFHEYKDLEIFRGRKFIDSPGAFGYIKTYLKILEDAKVNGVQRILILEDDVILVDDFHHKFQEFYSAVPQNWKLLQLGASQYDWKSINLVSAEEDGFYHPTPLHTCGSFGMAIHSDVYDELIQAQKHFDGPFDHIPMASIYSKNSKKCFVAFPNLVVPDVSSSSIREGRNQEEHGVKMKWYKSNYKFPLPKLSLSIITLGENNLKYIDISNNRLNDLYDVRWFVGCKQGLRPIHQNEYLTLDKIELNQKEPDLSGINLNSDISLLVSSVTPLTEELIIQKIDSILGYNSSSFSEEIIDITQSSKVYEPDLVSVIVPTYQRITNLENALQSIAKQTYHKIEVLVIDDNGIESEMQGEIEPIIDRFTAKISIKYIQHKSNLNGAAARNTGILHSRGEFICFLDDDDIYYPERIQKTIDKIKSTKLPNIGAVYCGYKGWNSQANDLNRYVGGDLSYKLLSLDFSSHYLLTNTVLYRKTALEKINGYDETFNRHQDLELNLRFFDHFEVDTSNEILVELNPIPSESSNKVYNEKMFDLKEKFLSRFEEKIKRFSLEEQEVIYAQNWKEASRFFKNQSAFISYCKSKNRFAYFPDIPAVQYYEPQEISAIEPSESSTLVTELKQKWSSIESNHHLPSGNYESSTRKNNEIETQSELVKKITEEKEWYARTYDHLPLWFLKIGSIFRRIKVKKGF